MPNRCCPQHLLRFDPIGVWTIFPLPLPQIQHFLSPPFRPLELWSYLPVSHQISYISRRSWRIRCCARAIYINALEFVQLTYSAGGLDNTIREWPSDRIINLEDFEDPRGGDLWLREEASKNVGILFAPNEHPENYGTINVETGAYLHRLSCSCTEVGLHCMSLDKTDEQLNHASQ